MARYTGASCRQCRREGMKLFLKGDRCYTDKCAIVKRNYAPGQHGQGRNGKKVDIPSLTVKVGDVIAVKETSKSSAKFKALVEANKVAPNWLDVNLEEMSAKVVALPTREDIDIEIAEHLIIELYSK